MHGWNKARGTAQSMTRVKFHIGKPGHVPTKNFE